MADAGFTLGKPLGYEQISDLSSAVGLTVPSGSRIAIIQSETQDVRWRDDGTDPTDAIGMVMTASDDLLVYTGDLSAIKFIETAASAALNVSYYS